jgi:hypothetical protein
MELTHARHDGIIRAVVRRVRRHGTVLSVTVPLESVMGRRLQTSVAVEAPIDRRDLLYPSPPLWMLQIQDLRQRPMEVKRDEGYLLVQGREGVA